jgi:hypothetical protein
MPAPLNNSNSIKCHESGAWIGDEFHDLAVILAQQCFDKIGRAIAAANPENLRRMTAEKAERLEILVLRYDHKLFCFRQCPNFIVIGFLQSAIAHMLGCRLQIREREDEFVRQMLIEEQFHGGDIGNTFRSRSAAKAKQARISSRVKSGKSSRISSMLIPPAR